ncbi:MAG: hypothetical protein Q9170_005247 [Blastenia crenularia]
MLQPVEGLVDLPNELFINIFNYLAKADLKGLRLVCSWLREVTTPLLFRTAVIAARRRIFDTFAALSNQSHLSKHVVEIIYDASFFSPEVAEQYRSVEGPSKEICQLVTSEARDKYVEAFDEQERILALELAATIRHAIKNFPRLQRLIYADFSRHPCFHWDRIEDLGSAYRLGDPKHTPEKAELSLEPPLLDNLCGNLSLRRKYSGLALLLRALSQPDCKAEILDLRIGDITYSRDAGGVPDTLITALSNGYHGIPSAFKILRKLDITISDCRDTHYLGRCFPHFYHLELLRLVGPMCSPTKVNYAPPLREPAIDFSNYCREIYWCRLRALELQWITIEAETLLNFLDRHRDTLRFINLYQIYVRERDSFGIIVKRLRLVYPSLFVEPYQRFQHFPSFETLILDLMFYDGQATLFNTGIPLESDESLDDYDEDQISNYSLYEGCGSDTSEDTESSIDNDFDGREEHQGLIDPL